MAQEKTGRSKKRGGKKRIKKQHDKNKLTARERLDLLLDDEYFEELDPFVTHRSEAFEENRILGDGVVTGYGTVHGRPVYVFNQDLPFLAVLFPKRTPRKFVK